MSEQKKVSLDGMFAELDALKREKDAAEARILAKQKEIDGYLSDYGFSRGAAKRRAGGTRAPRGSMADGALKYLEAHGETTTKALCADCKLTSGQAQSTMAGLVKRGLALKVGRGNYAITEAGRKAAGGGK